MSRSSEIWVGIATRNRPNVLENTLASLRAQKHQPARVLISDDSDLLEAQEGNRQLAKTYECSYLQGPAEGLYRNRNVIARACLEKATHLRTMDDDHTFPEGHWERCEEAVASDPDAIWNIGEYVDLNTQPSKPYPVPGELHPGGYSVYPSDLDRNRAFSDGAAIVPTSIFRSGNWYADQFKFGFSYLEFGSRLWFKGYHLRTLTTTYIYHAQNIGARAFGHYQETLAAMVFSTYCLSFCYQPSLNSKMRSVLEWGRQAGFHPGKWKAVIRGINVARSHVKDLA